MSWIYPDGSIVLTAMEISALRSLADYRKPGSMILDQDPLLIERLIGAGLIIPIQAQPCYRLTQSGLAAISKYLNEGRSLG